MGRRYDVLRSVRESARSNGTPHIATKLESTMPHRDDDSTTRPRTSLADFAEHFHGEPMPWLHRKLADHLAENGGKRIQLMLRPRQPRCYIGAMPPTRRAVVIDDMEAADE